MLLLHRYIEVTECCHLRTGSVVILTESGEIKGEKSLTNASKDWLAAFFFLGLIPFQSSYFLRALNLETDWVEEKWPPIPHRIGWCPLDYTLIMDSGKKKRYLYWLSPRSPEQLAPIQPADLIQAIVCEGVWSFDVLRRFPPKLSCAEGCMYSFVYRRNPPLSYLEIHLLLVCQADLTLIHMEFVKMNWPV